MSWRWVRLVLFAVIAIAGTLYSRSWFVSEHKKSVGHDYEPSLSETPREDKVIVVGHMEHEDTSWIKDELSDWHSAIYSIDNHSSPLHTAQNEGREANPYLTYLVDHYDDLPAIMAFLHPHKDGFPRAWHNDAFQYSNVHALRNLNLGHVHESGYVNLRCNPTPGCPDEIQPFRDWDDQNRQSEHEFRNVWSKLFNNNDVPEIVATPCCAQFAVTREQVLKRPKSDYVRFLQYLRSSPLEDAVLGRVYEYLWHIIFGKDPVQYVFLLIPMRYTNL